MESVPASPTLEQAREVLHKRFGHSGFRDGQEEVVRSALEGNHLLVVMPTGSGKSLLYQLPALLADGITLVVSPLIALMKDQVDELVRRGIPAAFINSSLSLQEQHERIEACARGEVRLLYVAPERFRAGNFLSLFRQVKIARMAVDEAHCISQWGHDFRPDYRRLKEFRERMGNPRVTALTATATPRVQQDIIASLGLTPGEVDVHVRGFDRPNLALSVVNARDDDRKFAFVRAFIGTEPGAGIIYTGTRRAAEELAETLRRVEKSVVVYHAGLEPEARARAQETFLSGKARIAVATIAFGMGIDKADIRFVIHYHLPGSVEQYYQEIGRAGRDGRPSRCVLLYSPGDRALREFFIGLNYPPPEIVEAVYRALWRIPENPVMLTYGEIARECDEEMKEGQVGSAVRLLDGAGLTRAQSGDSPATVGIKAPGASLLPKIRGPIQRRVFEALSVSVDLEEPGFYTFSLDELCEAAGLSEEQVRRALTALEQEGHIEYQPPFRGRGIEKRVDAPPPFNAVAIDWKRQQFLRGLEEEKLEAMEAYIRRSACRRGYILGYFGEDASFRCGTCDCCQERTVERQEERRAQGVLARRPDIALPVLVCVRNLRFPVGTGLVALILTGSSDKRIVKWKLTRNPAYGRVLAKKETIKDVIDALMQEGYLESDGEGSRPVLAVTPKGEEAADAANLDALRASEPEVKPRALPASAKVDRPEADDPRIAQAVLECVATVRPAVGVGKVAEVLTGSKAEWITRLKADELPVYDTVRARRERVRDVVLGLIQQGLLYQDVHATYPVLTLTDAGRAELEGRRAEAPAPVAAPTPPERAPVEEMHEEVVMDEEYAEAPAMPGPGEVLDALLGELMGAARDRAMALMAELRLFHPREVVRRLTARYEAAPEVRVRSRAAWVAGELGGEEALPFLLRCAQSDDADVRRLAASALGKVGARHAGDAALAALFAEARRALDRLARDRAPEVGQCAEKAQAEWSASETRPGPDGRTAG